MNSLSWRVPSGRTAVLQIELLTLPNEPAAGRYLHICSEKYKVKIGLEKCNGYTTSTEWYNLNTTELFRAATSRTSDRRWHMKKKLPQVYLEEPSRLTVPIVISNYRYKKPYTVNTGTENNRHLNKKREKYVSPARSSPLCRWYRNRRILKRSENEKERKKNEQEKLEKYQKKREKEQLKQLVKQHQHEQKLRVKQYKQEEKELRAIQYVREQKEQQYQQELKAKQYEQEQKEQRQESITEKIVYISPPVEKKAKRVIIGKSTSAKPKAQSKHVTVKRYKQYLPIRKRIANYFYRTCCQLYCSLSIILVLAFAIIMLV